MSPNDVWKLENFKLKQCESVKLLFNLKIFSNNIL